MRQHRALRTVLLVAGLLGIAWLAAAPALAAGYPEKPPVFIVAYAPGGGSDVAARIIAKFVEPHLGQSIAVENKPGAGGQIGFTALAKARPDGYTIGLLNVPSILLIKALRPEATYQMADFTPVANIQLDPVVVAVKPDSPFKTMQDLVAYAKQNPGKLNLSGDGPQTNNHLQPWSWRSRWASR
jgi:tripartite-type tricarboxylate transporter receptor subunit TctC